MVAFKGFPETRRRTIRYTHLHSPHTLIHYINTHTHTYTSEFPFVLPQQIPHWTQSPPVTMRPFTHTHTCTSKLSSSLQNTSTLYRTFVFITISPSLGLFKSCCETPAMIIIVIFRSILAITYVFSVRTF